MNIKRAGFYVEDRYFANRYSQAMARATHLADTYGRPVNVTSVDRRGNTLVETTIVRHADEAVAA